METIGYAALQIIPSMKGVSAEINRQLGNSAPDIGARAGRQFGSSFSSAMGTSMKAAGGAITALGATTLGLGAMALKAGYNYNVLGQKANAAFTTLLGSSEAAREFMGEIMDFASSSPFPRQTFIEGAQIMKAFGYATEDIIPALDAVQNAVAASGGSAQDLSEITYVLAQISAAGKITATDMMQLGQRGINAAELIGSQMGKTGTAIKDEITEGTLGANDALEALTQGMAEKFGGAADGVKATWVGAVDRVKGAMRDLGSAALDPFIGFDGGGTAVGWANTTADVIRALINGPLKDAAGAFDGLAEVGDKVFGVLGRLSNPRVMDDFIDLLGRIGPAAAGASTGLALLSSRSLLSGVPVLGNLLGSINPLVGALAALTLATPEARDALAGLFGPGGDVAGSTGGALLSVLEAVSEIAGAVLPPAINALGVGLEGVALVADPLADVIGGLGSAVSALTPVLVGGAAAWGAYKLAMGGVAMWTAAAAGAGKVGAALVGMRTALAGTVMMYQAAGGGIAGMGAALNALGGSIGIGTAAAGAFAGAAAGAGIAMAVMATEARKAQQRVDTFFRSLDVDKTDFGSLIDGMNEVNSRVRELAGQAESEGGDWKRFWQNMTPFTENSVQASIDEATKLADQWSAEYQVILDKAIGVSSELGGMSIGSVLNWAEKLNLDPAIVSTERLASAISEASAAAANGTPTTDALAGALGVLADETSNATDELKAFDDMMRKIMGGQLDVLGAQAGWIEELNEVSKLIKGKGLSLDPETVVGRETIAQMQAVVDAAMDYAHATGEAGNGAEDAARKLNDLAWDFAEVTKSVGLSDDKIKILLGTMGLMPDQIQVMVDAVTGGAEAKLDQLNTQMKSLDGKTATVRVKAAIDNIASNVSGAFGPIGVRQRRWGGIDQAHIGRGDLIRWAEPQTGGEAYIPRLGNKQLSEAILRTAAGWYGGRYISPEEAKRKAWPMARGGVVMAESAPVQSSGVVINGGVTVAATSGDPYVSGADFVRAVRDEDWLLGLGRR